MNVKCAYKILRPYSIINYVNFANGMTTDEAEDLAYMYYSCDIEVYEPNATYRTRYTQPKYLFMDKNFKRIEKHYYNGIEAVYWSGSRFYIREMLKESIISEIEDDVINAKINLLK
jgi:hypothetical protein